MWITVSIIQAGFPVAYSIPPLYRIFPLLRSVQACILVIEHQTTVNLCSIHILCSYSRILYNRLLNKGCDLPKLRICLSLFLSITLSPLSTREPNLTEFSESLAIDKVHSMFSIAKLFNSACSFTRVLRIGIILV